MLNKPAFVQGRRSGLEVEATKFKRALTMYVNRYDAIPTVADIGDDFSHIRIQPSCGPEFWGSNRLGSTALAASMLAQVEYIMEAGYAVTIDVNVMHSYGLIQMTQKFRKKYPQSFCIVLTLKISEPDLGCWCVRVEPGNVFTPYNNESGVYIGSYELLKEKGYMPWLAYGVTDERA